MATSPQISALHRLEFYKNKKQWKLCTSNYKENEPNTANKPDMNVTFEIEGINERNEEHNVTFIETVSDSEKTEELPIVYVTPEIKYNLSQVWLTNINIWPIDTTTEMNDNCLLQRFLENRVSEDENGGQGERYTAPMESNAPEDCPSNQADEVDNMESEETMTPNEFLLSLLYKFNLVQEEELSRSVSSYAQFSRGADLAPHCSEISLHLPDELSNSHVSANTLACLSTTQLGAAIHSQARVLAALLWENSERQKLTCFRNSTMIHEGIDEMSTHDITTYEQDNSFDNMLSSDRFVTGSITINEVEYKPKLIGIQAGRPVRL